MEDHVHHDQVVEYVFENGLLELDDIIDYIKRFDKKEIKFVFFTRDSETLEAINCPEEHASGIMIEWNKESKPETQADLEDREQNELRPDLDEVPDDGLTPDEEFDPPGTEEGGGRR